MSGRQRKAVRSNTGFGSGKLGGKPNKVHVSILKAGKKKRREEEAAGSLPMKPCPRCKNPDSHKGHNCGIHGQKNKNKAFIRAQAKGSVAAPGHSFFQPGVPAKKQAARQVSSRIRACSFACSFSECVPCCPCSFEQHQ